MLCSRPPPTAGDRTLDPTALSSELPTADDVVATAALLAGQIVHTPLIESPVLSERTGGRILLKAETLQYTGAFKFRGAMSRLARLTAAERARGVVAFSSGNHGQAIAAAGRRLGVPTVVAIPVRAARTARAKRTWCCRSAGNSPAASMRSPA